MSRGNVTDSLSIAYIHGCKATDRLDSWLLRVSAKDGACAGGPCHESRGNVTDTLSVSYVHGCKATDRLDSWLFRVSAKEGA